MLFLSAAAAWVSSLWTTILPLLPGFLAYFGWTAGTHFLSFTASWWIGRRYAANCLGTGISGLTGFYWTMGSPSCTALLFSHVSLLAVAVASLIVSMIFFTWFFYKRAKALIGPTIREIRKEAIEVGIVKI